MVTRDICPDCCEKLKKYDKVKRKVRTKRGEKTEIIIQRLYCPYCCKIHRLMPDDIVPYKRYEREVIDGVREGLITADTLGYEDYPSEKQMKRWIEK